MSNAFDGKVAIVTGGTGGIGSAIAKVFAQKGCRVIATDWNEAEIEARRNDPDFAGIALETLDVSDRDAVEDLAGRLDRVDFVVNCAGILFRHGDAFDDEPFEASFNVNVMGTLRVSRAMLPHLEKRGGAIVNFGSINSIFGSGTAPGYATSKGGVLQLTRSMAIAWAPKGIRVNAIAPGWIETPMSMQAQSEPALNQRILDRTPMHAWGKPEHLAGPAVFLCSPEAAWITGVMLPVDGGYSAV